MFSHSTIFSRAKIEKIKLFFTILIPIGIAFVIFGIFIMSDITMTHAMTQREIGITGVLLMLAGGFLTFYGFYGRILIPKIKNYMDRMGINSCTYGEYSKWEADQPLASKSSNQWSAQNNSWKPQNSNTSYSTQTQTQQAPNNSGTYSNTSGTNSSTQIRKMVFCSRCGAKMRVPDNGKKLNVTCPFCKNQFIV